MSVPAPERSIDPTLFAWPAADPALIASRCQDCGRIAFPARRNCMACGSVSVTAEELPRSGTLYTWTIQRFMPKEPYRSSETSETFRPFGLGYVELPGALRVETRLTENDPAKLKIGAKMKLVFYTHRVEPDGTKIINYAFSPA
jgi:uncharacterized OB-fold protein